MEIEIKRVSKEIAWELRHIVMWPNKDLDYIKLKDDDLGMHFGLFKNNVLTSVVSLFINNDEGQFRKFATLQQEQGKGYGSELLHYVLQEAQSRGVKRIWCNARKNKVNFYKMFGLQESTQTFKKGNIDYIVMEKYIEN